VSPLLDTHIWLWWLTGAPDLNRTSREALDHLAAQELPFISAISIWEAQMLIARRRLTIQESFAIWIRRMTAPDMIRILPLDASVVVAVHDLPASFHGDPADRIIVASAIAHGLTLATQDRAIRQSRLIKLWKP
jgi:PIN domain nuclease of toxin-antitoxin system